MTKQTTTQNFQETTRKEQCIKNLQDIGRFANWLAKEADEKKEWTLQEQTSLASIRETLVNLAAKEADEKKE